MTFLTLTFTLTLALTLTLTLPRTFPLTLTFTPYSHRYSIEIVLSPGRVPRSLLGLHLAHSITPKRRTNAHHSVPHPKGHGNPSPTL